MASLECLGSLESLSSGIVFVQNLAFWICRLFAAPQWLSETEKVGQEVVSHLSEDGLRVKLNALHYVVSVSYPHYYALMSPGSDFETGREAISLDDQGMVARCCKGIG